MPAFELCSRFLGIVDRHTACSDGILWNLEFKFDKDFIRLGPT